MQCGTPGGDQYTPAPGDRQLRKHSAWLSRAPSPSHLHVEDEPMVPISWQEMQCPLTKVIEQRKVAKVSAPDA